MSVSWLLRMCAVMLSSALCGSCARCILPDEPPDGQYWVTNPDDLPVTIKQVIVSDRVMTITYLDESGASQYVTYRLEDR